MVNYTAKDLENLVNENINRYLGIMAKEATKQQIYTSFCSVIRYILTKMRMNFKHKIRDYGYKQIYYMSMEFLLGRSLKNHLYNLGLTDAAEECMKNLGYTLEEIEQIEPDAGLGNGGLGRLAAAYMDALTSESYPACGFSIRYDYGLFKQKIVDGWQVELPDDWMANGAVWLTPRTEETFEVHFGGVVSERWTDEGLIVDHKGYTTVLALAYDMPISGYNTDAVNRIRFWASKAPDSFSLEEFRGGNYLKAVESQAFAESITKVLYPADDHIEGKALRLKQQYFFVSASVQSILKNHLKFHPNFDNLGEKVAIHINDTHPTLCIPELMRILLDDYHYSWEDAWKIVTSCISYTNHTVMQEALEKWSQSLFQQQLPRIYQIVCELNRRYCQELWAAFPNDIAKVNANAIMCYNEIRMANMCLYASHHVNGVSALHSEILKEKVFADAYKMHPDKYTNVTNGITHRRWLCEANPLLSDYIETLIGPDFIKNADLSSLIQFRGDKQVLAKLAEIKRKNKLRLAKFIQDSNDTVVNPDSIFDVQVKRLHEYKRQLLNCLNILDLYLRLKENPNLDITPRTFIFSAKAASSYYIAKLTIRLICMMAKQINNDSDIQDKLKVVFLENYRVSTAEVIIPAAEISEQISMAGKEASGTGNMKFMINGAITLGTMDGANVEIHENVGEENIFIFGLSSDKAIDLQHSGNYQPTSYYNNDKRLANVIDYMRKGIAGVSFAELADLLTIGWHGNKPDQFLCLADFASYSETQFEIDKAYKDTERWNRMSLVNIAKSGFFAADRAVTEYAKRIWNLKPVK